MENKLIYVEDSHEPKVRDDNSPITLEELADRIIAEGKKLAEKQFKEYKKEFNFSLSRPHIDYEKKHAMVSEALDALYLNSKFKKALKNQSNLKAQVMRSIEQVLDKEGKKEILWKYRYEIQVAGFANILNLPKKVKYLEGLIEEASQKPEPGEKLIWAGKPSEFGWFFNQLINAGYLKLAQHKRSHAKGSYLNTAQLLRNAFYISNQEGDGETSLQNLCNEITTPSLSDKEHGFFRIARKSNK
jgi:hypothetical protein